MVVVSSAPSCRDIHYVRVKDLEFAEYNAYVAQDTFAMLKRATNKPHNRYNSTWSALGEGDISSRCELLFLPNLLYLLLHSLPILYIANNKYVSSTVVAG